MMLTLGSLFDGIGGWLLAAVHNGVKPIWSSEIEKFPMAVTKHHFPDVIQFGDITKLDGATLPPVDIICAGSPCQDLSVAGKREGLKGERSGLFINAINIVRRMRMSTGGRQPRFFVWENVPGAFSSNQTNQIIKTMAQGELKFVIAGYIVLKTFMPIWEKHLRVSALIVLMLMEIIVKKIADGQTTKRNSITNGIA